MLKESKKIESSQTPLLDRSDSRVNHSDDFKGMVINFFGRIKSGDLGSLPVIIGLIVIWTIFSIMNPVFLSSRNLVNLLFDSSIVGIIALGIVCVLMLGEIDLSVGSMSGVGSAIIGVLWVNMGAPLPIAIITAILSGAIVGALYGSLRNRLGMPSFVSTLSGLLALLGLQLYMLGRTGSINLPYGSSMVNFGQLMVVPAWLSYCIAIIPAVVIIFNGLRSISKRQRMNLSPGSKKLLFIKATLITITLLGIMYYLNLGRGLPWMFTLFICLVVLMDYALTRTQWGRFMKAVGGNAEAARRAGVNVKKITISAFVVCSSLAALGGVMAASRLASASQQAGTGDVNLNAIAAAVIGGTSLFGGRGSAYSALLGIIVIQSISNGLTLLNLSSSFRFMITGAVLAIAVIIDSLARQSRASHGQA
jgi:D-xylose transport system permease protein